jgi:ubiquinone/menaquinone biosynthesis C-methylase UbiE
MNTALRSRNAILAERARAFDEWVSHYTWAYDLGITLHPLWGPRLRKAVEHIRGSRVLEVCFGTGYLLSLYADRFEATGVDYSPRMLEAARRRLAKRGIRANLMQGDAHALPLPDCSFDTLINTDAFTLFNDPSRAMSEFYRVLVPGGRMILLEYDWPKDRNWLGTKLMWIPRTLGMPYVAFDPLLREAGFEYEDHPVGMSGVLHMYIAHKPLTASETSAAPARS